MSNLLLDCQVIFPVTLYLSPFSALTLNTKVTTLRQLSLHLLLLIFFFLFSSWLNTTRSNQFCPSYLFTFTFFLSVWDETTNETCPSHSSFLTLLCSYLFIVTILLVNNHHTLVNFWSQLNQFDRLQIFHAVCFSSSIREDSSITKISVFIPWRCKVTCCALNWIAH